MQWDLTKPGWDHKPPDNTAAIEKLSADRFQSLDGDNGRARRARRAFFGFLVYSLDMWGAGPADEMAGNLGWFYLQLTDGESKHLLESARKHGMVRALGDDRDVYGSAIDPQWIPTDRGLKLAQPRGASTGDLWRGGLAIFDQIRVAFKDWWTLVALVAGLLSIQIARGDTLGGWLVIGLVVTIWTLILLVGLRGELDLKAMAQCWPRLAVYRPARYAWQVNDLRPWLEFGTRAVTFAGLAVAVLALVNGWGWWWAALLATGAFRAATWGVYRWRIRPLRRKWADEDTRVFSH